MLERDFQAKVIKRIQKDFPDSEVVPNDGNYIQGFPDLSVYFPNGRYVMLECKSGAKSKRRPNQHYYIQKFNKMSYAAFVHPKNEEEVFNEMERIFKS